jgi:acetyl-CoA synthetase
MVAHPLMAEAAVVGGADEVTGQAICTGEEARQPAAKLRKWVGEQIGAIAKPRHIRFGDNLPKTRSRKIMRRLPRSLAKGEKVTQDVSTLENPSDQLGEAFQRQHGKANAVGPTKECAVFKPTQSASS